MNLKQDPDSKKRKHIRFTPDPSEQAIIFVVGQSNSEFKDGVAALIMDEAPLSGCCLVVNKKYAIFEKGQACQIKLGHLEMLGGEVIWKKEQDDLVRYGFKFTE